MAYITLEAPPVLGTIETSLLKRFHRSLDFTEHSKRNPWASYTSEGFVYSSQTSLFTAFAKAVVDVVLEGDASADVSTLTIVPMRKLVTPNEVTVTVAGAWHRDSARFVVSNALVTEFLVGQLDVPVAENSDAYFNSTEFADIEKEHVYAPRPGEVVAFNANHLHRSAVNTTGHAVDRLFVQVLSTGAR